MLYVYGTEPAGFGLPVVSAALPGLPIVTNSMLNVLAPLPNVSAWAATEASAQTQAAPQANRNFDRVLFFIMRTFLSWGE